MVTVDMHFDVLVPAYLARYELCGNIFGSGTDLISLLVLFLLLLGHLFKKPLGIWMKFASK